jgi:hypothetical protein
LHYLTFQIKKTLLALQVFAVRETVFFFFFFVCKKREEGREGMSDAWKSLLKETLTGVVNFIGERRKVSSKSALELDIRTLVLDVVDGVNAEPPALGPGADVYVNALVKAMTAFITFMEGDDEYNESDIVMAQRMKEKFESGLIGQSDKSLVVSAMKVRVKLSGVNDTAKATPTPKPINMNVKIKLAGVSDVSTDDEPPPIGAKVNALWFDTKDLASYGFYPGTVERRNDDGTIDVKFDDGDRITHTVTKPGFKSNKGLEGAKAFKGKYTVETQAPGNADLVILRSTESDQMIWVQTLSDVIENLDDKDLKRSVSGKLRAWVQHNKLLKLQEHSS